MHTCCHTPKIFSQVVSGKNWWKGYQHKRNISAKTITRGIFSYADWRSLRNTKDQYLRFNLFYVIHTTGILVDIHLLGFMSYNSSYSLNSMGLLCLLQGLKLLNKSLIFSWTRNASKFCDGKLSNQRNSLFLSVGTSFIWPWSQQLSISQTIFLPFVFIPFQSSI